MLSICGLGLDALARGLAALLVELIAVELLDGFVLSHQVVIVIDLLAGFGLGFLLWCAGRRVFWRELPKGHAGRRIHCGDANEGQADWSNAADADSFGIHSSNRSFGEFLPVGRDDMMDGMGHLSRFESG